MTSVFLTRGVGVFEQSGLALCQSSTVIKPKMTVHDGLHYKVLYRAVFHQKLPYRGLYARTVIDRHGHQQERDFDEGKRD